MTTKAPLHNSPASLRGTSQPAGLESRDTDRRFPFETGHLDTAAAYLAEHRSAWSTTSLGRQIELAESCLHNLSGLAREWVDLACEVKGLPAGSPCRAEEVVTGPAVTARYLRLLIQSLRDIERYGVPRLPGRVRTGTDGRLHVPVVPAAGLFDSLVFVGCRAYVRMQAGVSQHNLEQYLARDHHLAGNHRAAEAGERSGTGRIVLVLGGGNVSSIPATDSLSKLFVERKSVLLKMHPLNAVLGPVFERAFAPLIEAGSLQIIDGDRDVGAAAAAHGQIDEVHITGSVDAHQAIVWGEPGEERRQRMRENRPVISKPVSSELGNVSPWIVVPGRYTNRQLQFQAENVAASFVNNASFNCATTRVLITSKNWPDRERFLDRLQNILAAVPRRKAYYPGAEERYRRFSGREPEPGEAGTLPWTLLRGVDPAESRLLFEEESFTSVLAEVALDAGADREFFEKAVDFANERLWGTLCATVTVPAAFRTGRGARAFREQLHRLRYAAVGVNHWPGLIYALVSPPWGGYPGGTPADPQSGRGWVHNSYMLAGVEQTVLEGPLTVFPKPLWFPTHARPEAVAWKLLELYQQPSIWRYFDLSRTAMRGAFG